METFGYLHRYHLQEKTSDLSTVGGRLKYYRRLKGLSQRDVYEKIGIDKSSYIHYEGMKTNLDPEMCKKICEVIGIEPELVYDDYMAFISSDYGTSIKEYREKHGMTQKEFGEILDMHPKISARWERGRSEPSRKSYDKMRNLLI